MTFTCNTCGKVVKATGAVDHQNICRERLNKNFDGIKEGQIFRVKKDDDSKQDFVYLVYGPEGRYMILGYDKISEGWSTSCGETKCIMNTENIGQILKLWATRNNFSWDYTFGG